MSDALVPVTAIVVTFNPGPELVDCLHSLRSQGDDVRILLIDNSTDAGAAQGVVALGYKNLWDELIVTGKNLGFAAAVNIGIRRSAQTDIFLMNPDATLDDDCIASLRSELNGDNSIGILVPVVRSGTGIRTMSAGRLPTIRALFTHYFGLSRAFPSAAIFEGRYLFLGVHDKIDRDIEWAAGCCLYITQNAIRQVGLFSERWFMYGEDIDYCKRTRDRGFSIRLVTDATAFHAMAVSVSAIPGAGSLMWPVNTFDFYRSAYDPGLVRRITWKAIFSLGLSSRAFLIPVRGRFAGASWRRGLRLFRLAMAVWYLPPVLNEPDHFDEGSQTPWRESILQSDLAHGRGDRDQ